MSYILLPFILYCIPNAESLLSNLTYGHSNLPEISEGEPCVSGKIYKMSCNTCRCGVDNALMCTKMGCLTKEMVENLKKKQAKQNLREEEMRRTFSDLPTGKCEAGTLYKKGCQICFCDDKSQPKCSKKSCRSKLKSHDLKSSEYLDALPVKEINKLPSLAHMGASCDQGKMYKVDCNTCLCLKNGDLMCSQKLCPTSEGLNRAVAFQKSGHSCSEGSKNKVNCVQCECVDGKTECLAMINCKQQEWSPELLSSKKLSGNDKKEKCIPNMIYRVHCNYCYCQSDGSLRCTQKLCLVKSEAEKLDQQRLYLQKYGL